MKILVLNGSPRKTGNTAAHVNAFKEGAESKGHEVNVICVGNMKINGCIGCEYCHGEGMGKCIQHDDMDKVYASLSDCDMVVLASPIYYWGFSGQMMSVITRFYNTGKPKAKKYAMFLSSGSPDVYDAPIAQYKSMLQYFRAEDLGILTANGEDNSSPAALARFKEFGMSL